MVLLLLLLKYSEFGVDLTLDVYIHRLRRISVVFCRFDINVSTQVSNLSLVGMTSVKYYQQPEYVRVLKVYSNKIHSIKIVCPTVES